MTNDTMTKAQGDWRAVAELWSVAFGRSVVGGQWSAVIRCTGRTFGGDV